MFLAAIDALSIGGSGSQVRRAFPARLSTRGLRPRVVNVAETDQRQRAGCLPLIPSIPIVRHVDLTFCRTKPRPDGSESPRHATLMEGAGVVAGKVLETVGKKTMTVAGEDAAKAAAVRVFAARYLDFYCSGKGVPRDAASALFEELAQWYEKGSPEQSIRGLTRRALGRKAGLLRQDLSGEELKKQFSGLDKALRTIAQNLQIFGHRRKVLKVRGVKTTKGELDTGFLEVFYRVAPIDEHRTVDVDGDPCVLCISGPTSLMRGDTERGRYFLTAEFRPVPLVAETLTRAIEGFENQQDIDRVLPRLRELLSDPPPRGVRSLADRSACMDLLRSLPEKRDEKARYLRGMDEMIESYRANGEARLVLAVERTATLGRHALAMIEYLLDAKVNLPQE
jgi:hypothetical protein